MFRNSRSITNGAQSRDALPLTATSRHNLELELERLQLEREAHVERLRGARQYGEPSGNDELMSIREDETIIEARIARLEDILARAVIVDPARSGESITIGSAVTVRDRRSRKTSKYVIEGAHGSLEPNVISAVSPMGRALIGSHAGALVPVELPRGRMRRFEVVDIRQSAL
jgi:transcription elongation factor GreA